MSKFAVFYLFSDADSTSALLRLRRLCTINPDVTFIPAIGIQQLIHLPMIVDDTMFGSTKRLRIIGPLSHLINSLTLSAPGIFKLSHAINKKVGFLNGQNKIDGLHAELRQMGLQTLYADFTPMVLYNCDHVIMHWFNTLGKQLDFDYLIFYEFDIYTTKPIDTLYSFYSKSYDACFNEYAKATPNWHFYNYPPGCNRAIRRWLRQRKLPTTLYRSIFGGAMLSRRVLERLQRLSIDFSETPHCCEEMRMPTVITALGFKCGKLNFPFYRYRPVWSEREIQSNEDAGIFHPVKTLISTEKKL